MTTLWIDLETRSRCDLRKYGLYNYAADKSTEILIACYAIDNGPIHTWQAWKGKPIPTQLSNALTNKRVEVRAHNAAFERMLLAARGYTVPIERWYCTSMQARACAMPAGLEDLGRAAASSMRKDHRGSELIRKLSVPQANGEFIQPLELMHEFERYCVSDVGAMRTISLMLPALTPAARAVWNNNEVINDRGLPIDTELCALALKYADVERREANDRVVTLSGGELKTARGIKIARWVYERLPEEARSVMEVKRTGDVTLTLDVEARNALTIMADEQPELLDEAVLEMVGAADAAAAASVAKFRRMKDFASADGRLRGAFVAFGASQTGRFSSRGAQLHNYPRLTAKDPNKVKAQMREGATLDGQVLQVLKSMLRPAITAGSGRRIVRCDWNAVEARGLPWLAGPDAVKYLEAFRDTTRDIYVEQAAACGLKSRQAGKVLVLALGYGGALGALNVMSKGYGVTIENGDKVVSKWRKANNWAPLFWHRLDSTARDALSAPGQWHNAGRLALRCDPEGLAPLRMRLPSGRELHYPEAAIEPDEKGRKAVAFLKSAWKPRKDAKRWPRARLWGGLSSENGAQGTCADLLCEALQRASTMPIIGHVHDEIVLETTAKQADNSAKQLQAFMLTTPDWAEGFPLAAEIDISERFRK